MQRQIESERPVSIAGAGSIGCFVGGMLAAAGRTVVLLARPRIVDEIRGNGLRLTSFDGTERVVADRLMPSDDPAILGQASAVLVTVKSGDTAEMADIIARHAAPDAVVVSLQNGGRQCRSAAAAPGGAEGARRHGAVQRGGAGRGPFPSLDLGRHRDRAGRRRHRASAVGARACDPRHRQYRRRAVGQAARQSQQCAHALSGLTLRRQLAQRDWRRLLADQIAEGLAAIRAEGITPVSPTPLPSGWAPPLLRLPDPLFQAVLGRAMKIDPEARSSMWEDLQRGRRTEIDYLQGVITAIARRRGLGAPLSSVSPLWSGRPKPMARVHPG